MYGTLTNTLISSNVRKTHNLDEHSILKHKYINKKSFTTSIGILVFVHVIVFYIFHLSTMPLYRLTKHMKNQKLNYHLLEYKPFK